MVVQDDVPVLPEKADGFGKRILDIPGGQSILPDLRSGQIPGEAMQEYACSRKARGRDG